MQDPITGDWPQEASISWRDVHLRANVASDPLVNADQPPASANPCWPAEIETRAPMSKGACAQSSSRSRLFCKPSLDQRLIRNVPLVSSNLDAFEKRQPPLKAARLRYEQEAKSIPKFRSEAEERRFWQTHESSDYIDRTKAARVRFPDLKPSTTAISLRLPVTGRAISTICGQKWKRHYKFFRCRH